MERPVMPPACARVLFGVSFITLASFCVASVLRVYDGMVVTAAVLFCSINHWRRPVYGARRNVDICNNAVCLAYQTWRSFAVGTPYTACYLLFTYAGVGCFFWGRRLDKTNLMHGVYAHSFVHILGNIGNVILYVGLKAAQTGFVHGDNFWSSLFS